MKIMVEYSDGGSVPVRSGWLKVFKFCGHDGVFWNPQTKSAFDAFSEFEPDIFIGTTYGTTKDVYKCIKNRPNLKVAMFCSAWGKLIETIDKQKYPIVVVSEQEKRTLEQLKKETGQPEFVFIHVTDLFLEATVGGWNEIGIKSVGILNAADIFQYINGIKREHLKCDIGYVGGRWGYKSRNIDNFLLPLLHPDSGFNCKVFGNTNWPTPYYLGKCSNDTARDLFVSATVCPSISESHSTDLGFDLVERNFKVISSGGVCISDYVEEGRYIFTENELPMAKTPEEYKNKIIELLNNEELKNNISMQGKREILKNHTYFDRVVQMFVEFQLENEAQICVNKKKEYLELINEK